VPRDSVEKKIRFELDQIGKLLDKYDDLLILGVSEVLSSSDQLLLKNLNDF